LDTGGLHPTADENGANLGVAGRRTRPTRAAEQEAKASAADI